MSDKATKTVSGHAPSDHAANSMEIEAAGAIAQALVLPVMSALLVEAEALSAMLPGQHWDKVGHLVDRSPPDESSEPFDNMPV